MDLINQPPSVREAHEEQANRERLVERIARAVGEDGAVEVPGDSGWSAGPRPRSWPTASPPPRFA
jgi:hypothetical protein